MAGCPARDGRRQGRRGGLPGIPGKAAQLPCAAGPLPNAQATYDAALGAKYAIVINLATPLQQYLEII